MGAPQMGAGGVSGARAAPQLWLLGGGGAPKMGPGGAQGPFRSWLIPPRMGLGEGSGAWVSPKMRDGGTRGPGQPH